MRLIIIFIIFDEDSVNIIFSVFNYHGYFCWTKQYQSYISFFQETGCRKRLPVELGHSQRKIELSGLVRPNGHDIVRDESGDLWQEAAGETAGTWGTPPA